MEFALVMANNGTKDLEVSIVGFEDSKLLHDGLKEHYAKYDVIQSSGDLLYIKALAWDVSSALRVAKRLTGQPSEITYKNTG